MKIQTLNGHCWTVLQLYNITERFKKINKIDKKTLMYLIESYNTWKPGNQYSENILFKIGLNLIEISAIFNAREIHNYNNKEP